MLVHGLEEEGPGDVVGALTGEADVDSDRIGEIEIDGEEALVADYARTLLEAGLEPEEPVIISPYSDQVHRLENELPVDGLEIDTVDGFQGREKEAVIVSLVRSNDRGAVGFLEESRRFNVALTRARRKAVVVGDSDTVTEVDVLDDFLAYVRDRGTVVDAV